MGETFIAVALSTHGPYNRASIGVSVYKVYLKCLNLKGQFEVLVETYLKAHKSTGNPLWSNLIAI